MVISIIYRPPQLIIYVFYICFHISFHIIESIINLQKILIEATTDNGDLVLDPASGGYSVFEACKLSGISFIGGDIEFGDEPKKIYK